jgi:hypothetical protein
VSVHIIELVDRSLLNNIRVFSGDCTVEHAGETYTLSRNEFNAPNVIEIYPNKGDSSDMYAIGELSYHNGDRMIHKVAVEFEDFEASLELAKAIVIAALRHVGYEGFKEQKAPKRADLSFAIAKDEFPIASV